MSTSELSGKPDEMLGGYLCWTSIPSRRSSNTPSHFMQSTTKAVQRYLLLWIENFSPSTLITYQAYCKLQVINAARTLAARPHSKVARENMDVFKEAWEQQLQVLTEAVDDITGIEDFLATTGK